MALYSGKIGVWGGSQTMWDSFYTDLCAKIFPYIVFWNPNYVCILGYVLSMHTHGLSVHTNVHVCVRTLRVSSSLYFQKIVLFFQKQFYIFHKYFLKSIFTRLGPKLTLGLRVLPSLRNGGMSRMGYKIGCLQQPLF